MSDFTNINNFYTNSALISKDILRQSRFKGILKSPSIPSLPEEFLTWNLTKVKCSGFELGTGYKEVDMMPRYYIKNWVLDDLSISYLETSDMQIRKWFYQWMDNCLTTDGYKRNYYDEVKSDLFTIEPLDGRGNSSTKEVFRDLVPFKIDSLEYDTSSSDDQLVHTTVFFKYLSHSIE